MPERSNGQPLKVKALRFQYRKGIADHSFETMPFYLNVLRGFLRKNAGNIVWLKGGVIEQPAYLLFTTSIENDVVKILSQPLADLGKYEITPVQNPLEIARKYAFNLRVAIGWLKLPNLELGSPETVPKTEEEEQILEKVREGFMLTEYWFIKADDVEIRGEWAILKNVVEVGIGEGNKINYVHKQDKMGIRVKDLKFHPQYLRMLTPYLAEY